jgi:cytochrome oxidase Cu insertion factor (SCO1/SenC/PrrC family)
MTTRRTTPLSIVSKYCPILDRLAQPARRQPRAWWAWRGGLWVLLAAMPAGILLGGGVPAAPALWDGTLTNELGRPVTLDSFRGQALAISFFYTRCPMPDFCPRLSKNFQEASRKIEAMTNAPGNWHFLSVSFDPEFDTPPVLQAYGQRYQYDPAHWSFLTGEPEQIGALAQAVGSSYKHVAGTFDHNFRTVILDAAGRVRMIFPTGGNLSDQIVEEILKAAAATNQPTAQDLTSRK